MINITNEILKYSNGEYTLEEINNILKGTGISIDPNKNKIDATKVAIICDDVTKINGYALLDTGTGSLDKVAIINGKLSQNIGKGCAMVIVGTRTYVVTDGETLEEK